MSPKPTENSSLKNEHVTIFVEGVDPRGRGEFFKVGISGVKKIDFISETIVAVTDTNCRKVYSGFPFILTQMED